MGLQLWTRSVWRRLIFGALVLGFCSIITGNSPVAAQSGTGVFRVATTGNDNPACGSAGQPCRTVQYAVNIANSGDTILVAAGTYTEFANCSTGTAVVCIIDGDLTILGGYTTGNWTTANPAANVTILDGQNTRRVIRVQKSTPASPVTGLRLEGFTVRNGRIQGGASGSDTQTFAFGGGLLAENAPVTLRNVIFRNNHAIGGTTSQAYGGAGAGGAVSLNSSQSSVPAVLEHVTFENNQALGGNGQVRGGLALGGAIFTLGAVVSGNDLTFTDNVAQAGSSNGGGTHSDGLMADALGGAVSIEQGSTVTFQTVTATGNSALGGNAPNGNAGGAYGGAFFVELASLTLTDAELRNNLAEGGDGTNSSSAGSLAEGGGIQSTSASVVLDRATVIDNTARGGNGSVNKGAAGGGGVAFIRFSGNSTFQISNSIIANNTVALGSTGALVGGGGGGLWLQGVAGNISHATIAQNTVASPLLGQAVILAGGAPSATSVNFAFTIIAEHDDAGTDAVYVQSGNTATLNRTLWADNTDNTNDGEPSSGTVNESSPINAGSAGFVSPGSPNFNYHILGSSLAKDQATGSAATTDVDNESRAAFAPRDVGADEYAPIVLTAAPFANGSVRLTWKRNTSLVTGLDHYDIVYSFEAGGQPANEGSSPIDAGTSTSFTLTGLTNYKEYTFTIQARNSGDGLIASSNTVSVQPTDIFVYLPAVLR